MFIASWSRHDSYQIQAAVNGRADYVDVIENGGSTEYVFRKISFAGKIWDYGHFNLNSEGVFYSFTVYDCFECGAFDKSERKKASDLYDNMKSKLDSKYSTEYLGETSKENLLVALYHADNVSVALTNKKSKSYSGQYIRYVNICYALDDISSDIERSAIDEL